MRPNRKCESPDIDQDHMSGRFALQVGLLLGGVLLVALVAMHCRSRSTPVPTGSNVFAVLPAQIEGYNLDVGEYPPDLSALITNRGHTNWRGPYVRSTAVPLDPWGHPFRYRRDRAGYELRSAGPDRRFMTNDDITERGHGTGSGQTTNPTP